MINASDKILEHFTPNPIWNVIDSTFEIEKYNYGEAEYSYTFLNVGVCKYRKISWYGF